MSAHIANAELNKTSLLPDMAAVDPMDAEPLFAADTEERAIVRGVVNAVIISIPFWCLFGFVLYLLS